MYLLMRQCGSSDLPPPPAPRVAPTFVARQTPSAADGSLGVKMLDRRVLGLSQHQLVLYSFVRFWGNSRIRFYSKVVYTVACRAPLHTVAYHIQNCNASSALFPPAYTTYFHIN